MVIEKFLFAIIKILPLLIILLFVISIYCLIKNKKGNMYMALAGCGLFTMTILILKIVLFGTLMNPGNDKLISIAGIYMLFCLYMANKRYKENEED